MKHFGKICSRLYGCHLFEQVHMGQEDDVGCEPQLRPGSRSFISKICQQSGPVIHRVHYLNVRRVIEKCVRLFNSLTTCRRKCCMRVYKNRSTWRAIV